VASACGDDSGGGTSSEKPPKQAPAQAVNPPPGAAGAGKQLPVVEHIEKRVTCPQPKQGSKHCDPLAPKVVTIGKRKAKDKAADPTCEEGEYCLPTSEGPLCGVCPERDQIRHIFETADFAPEQNRDPFQSFVVKPLDSGSGSDGLQKDLTSRCPRPDQLQASSYGYRDLKLVGIVAQGTQRKVLMLDTAQPQFGHIIKRGDCVGKEKAWVKEIGENFVCFEISADPSSNRPAESNCIELHPKIAAPNAIPSEPPTTKPTTVTPVVPPPPSQPPRTTKTEQAPPPAPAGSGVPIQAPPPSPKP
jgi:Tfp pilus assembly protein PilP